MTTKQQLEQAIYQGDKINAAKLLEIYQNDYAADFDRFSILANYYLMLDDWKSALSYAKEAVHLNPHSLEAAYNMAYISEGMGYYVDAYKYYRRLFVLQRVRHNILIEETLVEEKLRAIENMTDTLPQEEKQTLENAIILSKVEEINASKDPFYGAGKDLIGEIFMDELGNASYVGRYGDWYNQYWGKKRTYDAYDNQVEMFAGATLTSYLNLDMGGQYILPVVSVTDRSEQADNTQVIENQGKKVAVNPGSRQTYRYFRLDGPVETWAKDKFIAANPIMLGHKKQNKKLVLNIFIDSFNYRVFSLASDTKNEMDGFSKLMPNTYAFFKKGTILTNAFVDSEWTTPSLSSYWTGVHSPKHMALDADVWWPFSKEYKLLPEYFKEAGYMTARLGNNNSAAPSKGYMRGIDRALFQSGHVDVGDTVKDIINQIAAFSECDQFVWVNFANLHAVAGNFLAGIDVQTQTPLTAYEKDNETKSTVKQGRSFHKQQIYMRELTHMDTFLGMLFQYITTHYSEEEYVVSLFSDHGTAFMVDDNQPIICKQRMQVPMMFRADKNYGQISEMVESVDFAGILLKLAGIPYDETGTDASLPVFLGGEKKREYVIAQTLFQGDPYQAVVMKPDMNCYVRTQTPVDSEFRIDARDIDVWIEDNEGHLISDEEEAGKCKQIVLDNVAHLIKYE